MENSLENLTSRVTTADNRIKEFKDEMQKTLENNRRWKKDSNKQE